MTNRAQRVRGRLLRALGGVPAQQPARQGPPPGRRALKEVRALRERVAQLEEEVQEGRHLNKRLAEIVDVVAEVLLPAGDRDEERLTRLLQDYDRAL